MQLLHNRQGQYLYNNDDNFDTRYTTEEKRTIAIAALYDKAIPQWRQLAIDWTIEDHLESLTNGLEDEWQALLEDPDSLEGNDSGVHMYLNLWENLTVWVAVK